MIDFGDCYMMCDECPIGEAELRRRRERLTKYGFEDWQPEYCCCDKIGEEHFWMGGYCEDAFVEKEPVRRKGERRGGRAYRRYMNRKKDAALRRIINCKYVPWAGYVKWDWVDGVWSPVGDHIKYPKNSNILRYYKRLSNRTVRRYKDTFPKGNHYRKCFEYVYSIF